MRTGIPCILTIIYLSSLPGALQASLHALPLNPHALAEAAANGDINLIKELSGRGADVNYPDESGQTPLDHAAGNGDRTLADFLLRQGANPDRIDSQGLTPVMRAIILARPDILSLLLRYSTDPNLVSYGSPHSTGSPLSAFTLAVNLREFSMARMLMEHGATPLLSIPPPGDNRFIYPQSIQQPAFTYNIDAAIWRGLGRLRYNTSSPDWLQPRNEQWLLHRAAHTNNLDMLRNGLYNARLSPDTRSFHGVTPLMVASRHGHFGMASLLLANGASPRLRDNEGRTAIAYASAGGSLEMVSLLVAQFIEEGEGEPDSSLIASPHLYALLNADSAMFRHLLSLGLDWGDLSLTEGITLPMVAAWLGDEFALSLMLPDMGSRAVQADQDGRNTLSWALAAFRREREVAREHGRQGRVVGLHSLLRRLASLRPLRLDTAPLIIESWSEQPSWEVGIRQWRQLTPSPVPLAGEEGDYTVHKIIRNEEAIK